MQPCKSLAATQQTTSMTRSDLIARLSELHPQLQLKDTDLAVKVILDTMSNTLYQKVGASRYAASVALD